MATNTISFTKAYPVDFKLYNKDGDNILYIADKNVVQEFTLEVCNSSERTINLNGLSGTPDEANHHLAMRFRPGVLAEGNKAQQTAESTSQETLNLLNGIYTGGQAKVVYIGGTAYPYASNLSANCGSSWRPQGTLCDEGSYAHSKTVSYKSNGASGATWRNGSGKYGSIIIDLGAPKTFDELAVFQMFSDGKTTHIRFAAHPSDANTHPTEQDSGWNYFNGDAFSEVGAGSQNGKEVTQPTTFNCVPQTTRYLKIDAKNDGTYGRSGYIEIRSVKMFCTEKAPANPQKIQLSPASHEDWTISDPVVDLNRQEVVFYFLAKAAKSLAPGESLTIGLQNLNANASHGTRATQIALAYHSLFYENNEEVAASGRVVHIRIKNHVGQRRAPIHVGIVGDSGILNDGSANDLTLRISNLLLPNTADPKASRIPFAYDGNDASKSSKFVITFDTKDTNEEWVLEKASKVKEIQMEMNPPEGWTVQEAKEGASPSWTFQPEHEEQYLDVDKHFDIVMSNIRTSYYSGTTYLHFSYENIPGFWDGELIVPIKKRPLVFNGDKVGIGVSSPSEKLHVVGLSRFEGGSGEEAAAFLGRVGIGTNSPRAMLEVGHGTRTISADHQLTVAAYAPGTSVVGGKQKTVKEIVETVEFPVDVYSLQLKVNINANSNLKNTIKLYINNVQMPIPSYRNPATINVGDIIALDGIRTIEIKSRTSKATPNVGPYGSSIVWKASVKWDLTYKSSDEVTGAIFSNNVGIGTASPKNTLDVKGGAVIGSSYSGNHIAPSEGLLVQGKVGIGTINPKANLDVNGSFKVRGKSVIKDIRVGSYDREPTEDISDGWYRISGDLNEGAGGKYIYLEVQYT